MWRLCQVQPSHKERAIARFVVKRRGCCCNRSASVALECVVHHERNVCKEKHPIYVVRTSNNRVIVVCDLYYCLLPQCKALRTCHSGFPIATSLLMLSRLTFLLSLLKALSASTNIRHSLFPLCNFCIQHVLLLLCLIPVPHMSAVFPLHG